MRLNTLQTSFRDGATAEGQSPFTLNDWTIATTILR